MAGTDHSQTSQEAHHMQQLTELRQAAQWHLTELETEDVQAKQVESRKQQELEKYRKVGGKKGSKPNQQTPEPLTGEASKLRPAQDVLDRLRWDSTYKTEEYIVGYLERFEGLKEMPMNSWKADSTHEEWIPQHRIKYISHCNGEIVWDRDARIDNVFQSGRGSQSGS